MGTVHSQPARMQSLEEGRVIAFADSISKIAKESNITYLEALETFKTLALINDYDAKDEQISGIADILERIKNV